MTMKTLWTTAAAVSLLMSAASAQDLKFTPGEGEAFNWASFEAFKQDLSGQKLTIDGPWSGPDKELFESIVAYFEAATGADVDYVGSEGVEQRVVISTEAGSPPDIAILPQPGLMRDLAARGHLTDLGAETADWLRDNYAAGESWVSLSTAPGKDGTDGLYGLFFKVDLKSLVWYVPENFEDAGYEVPETMEELKTLTEQIVADGGTPWCIGLGSGGATGWPATDWVEDMMLCNTSPENYDKWVSNELAFNSPEVIGAIEDYGWFSRNDAFVAGGAAAIAATEFQDSPKGLFSSPPQCYLHHQASFIPSFFPEGTVVGEDADFFYFPAYAEKDLGRPVLGGGTLFVLTKDTPVARAFIEFLKTPIAHEVWMAQKGFLTPFKSANTEAYGDETLKKMGEILLNATTFRFDASDLMPGAVGAGAFWTGMVDYAGGKSAADVGATIQSTWDALK